MSDALDPADLDPGVHPGDDFDRYVNGRWKEANPIPPEYSAWGSFEELTTRNEELLQTVLERAAAGADDRLERLVGDYYAAGMDEDAIDEAGAGPLAPHLDAVDAIGSADDVRDLAVSLHAAGLPLLFGRSVAPDFADASRYLVWFGQGGLGLPERDYYTREDDESVALRTAYGEHVAAQLANLGAGEAEAEDAAGRILAFETSLAGEQLPAAERRDLDRTINRHDRAALAALAPRLDLDAYLVAAGAGDETSVNVDHPAYFAALDDLLHATDVATLGAYARWHVVRAAASSLSRPFEEEAFAFYGRRLGGQQEQKPRWKRVLAAATQDIGEAVGASYVALAFSEEAKERAEAMVVDIVAEMRRSLESLPWMTDDTRGHALEKLGRIRTKIGFPDRWREYDGLDLVRAPFVENRLRAARFEEERQIARLGTPVDRDEWMMPPHVVNAYYHPLLNEIVFPAAILQPPMFSADADDALNYGAVGSVIGHEITHGFDDQGRKFDADGAFTDWWSETDAEQFSARADRLAEQYDAYEVLDGVSVNGRLTLGENIADLGGVALAHRALLHGSDQTGSIDGLTPSQRFFIAYARVWRANVSDERLRMLTQTDPHAPRHLRIAGPLANLDAFAAAFGLDDDAPMLRAPEERITIW